MTERASSRIRLLSILILLFAIKLGLLPVSGAGSLAGLVLPAITMGGALAAILTRMVRTSMLEELSQDYIRTARAKGLSERTVVYRHALRNAMIPILTVLGLQFGALLAGAIVTETIFAWPGIGRLTIQAISNRDYYLVQGCILAIGLTYVAVNFLTDALYSVASSLIRSRSAFLESSGGGFVTLGFLAEASPLAPASEPESLARGRFEGRGAAFRGACSSSSSSSSGSSSTASSLTGTRSMLRKSSSTKVSS
jgi:hypothetical protein